MADLSNALQRALYEAVTAADIGAPLFDDPRASAALPYLTFGPSDEVPDDAECIPGFDASQQIDIWSDALDGFREAKALGSKLRSALHGAELPLASGAIVFVEVRSLRFLDDPDGTTKHGVATIRLRFDGPQD